MLTLDTGQTFSGKAGTTGVINYAISKDLITTGDSFTPTQGVLTNSAATLYTSTGGQSLFKEIQLQNTSGSIVSGITFYIIGTASTNQWGPVLTIPANGGATYDSAGKWNIYGPDGIILSAVGGAAGGDLSGAYPNPLLRQGVARSVIGVTGNATGAEADIQGATDQVLRVNGAGTALAFGAIDLSKSAAAGGVIQAASFPALTGDVTTSAGALATTVANDAVVFAKMQNINTDSLIGRDTAGSGDPENILLNATLSMDGSGNLQRAALTGDITAPAGSNATTLKNTGPGATGPIGSASVTPVVTIDNQGRVTALTSATVTPAAIGAVPTTRTITTTAPLTIDAGSSADLSANRTLAVSDATFTTRGAMTATEKIVANSQDGRTSTGTSPRVFRPGDYMVGNTYDPTGSANSTTAFQAMMTAIAAWNDRFCIQLAPGVFKLDPGVIKNFGTNNTSFSIIGPGRGCCILLPTDAGDMITLNRNTTGGDSITIRGFTIYNTSGTPYTSGAGILTNGADAVDISEVAFIDLFRDIQVSGQPYTFTTNGTTAISSVSPSFVAADVGQVVSGPGITPGTTLSAQAGTSGTLSGAATVSTADVRFLNNSIKVSMQKIVSFNTNGNGSGVGIYVNNGQAGDTYMGPDIVMSDGGGTTRRRACIEIVESGHYEIVQANLTGSQRGLLIDPGASQVVGFGFHTNILCDSNTINGMLIDTLATTATVKNIKSVNSWYSGTTVVNGSAAAAGVKTQATAAGTLNGLTFTTDRFLNNRTHGFEHAAGTDLRWSDCDLKGNSSVGSAQADGLNVAANVGNWSINGGKYGGTDTVPTAGNQRYGINVAAGTGNNIKISPDDLSGNVTGPLLNGATGQSVFVNGCPGLYTGFSRGATTTTAAATAKTVGATFVPKGSLSTRSSWRVTVTYQHIGAGTVPTISCRFGTTNDAVDTTATNAVVASVVGATGAANAWGQAYFTLVINQLGAGTGIIGAHGWLVQVAVLTSLATAARANGAGMLNNINTTSDNYLTVSATTTATAGLTILGATIEPISY